MPERYVCMIDIRSLFFLQGSTYQINPNFSKLTHFLINHLALHHSLQRDIDFVVFGRNDEIDLDNALFYVKTSVEKHVFDFSIIRREFNEILNAQIKNDYISTELDVDFAAKLKFITPPDNFSALLEEVALTSAQNLLIISEDTQLLQVSQTVGAHVLQTSHAGEINQDDLSRFYTACDKHKDKTIVVSFDSPGALYQQNQINQHVMRVIQNLQINYFDRSLKYAAQLVVSDADKSALTDLEVITQYFFMMLPYVLASQDVCAPDKLQLFSFQKTYPLYDASHFSAIGKLLLFFSFESLPLATLSEYVCVVKVYSEGAFMADFNAVIPSWLGLSEPCVGFDAEPEHNEPIVPVNQLDQSLVNLGAVKNFNDDTVADGFDDCSDQALSAASSSFWRSRKTFSASEATQSQKKKPDPQHLAAGVAQIAEGALKIFTNVPAWR